MIVSIRPSTLDDINFIVELETSSENAAYVSQWKASEHKAAIESAAYGHWIVATSDRRVGYIVCDDLRSNGRGYYVRRMVVVEKNKKYGREALGKLVDYARNELGANLIWLSVAKSNTRAQRSYLSQGFVFGNSIYGEDWHSAVGGSSESNLLMVKSL